MSKSLLSCSLAEESIVGKKGSDGSIGHSLKVS